MTETTRADAFSDTWARAWCDALNASPAYRTAAATWEGAAGLVMTNPPDAPRAVYLDLWHGECRGVRTGDLDVLADARYVLEATRETWREVLSLRQSPVFALMSGRLRLTRGSLGELMPFANAAKELLGTASTIEAVFPED
ncbi:MAG TPA: hypothetical protein VFS40_09730 [Gemmatimonadales bacterium]|nr:hypothetical protein [Gemmatimonadales bacterium]